ncbi:MAG: hypothetical protein FH748_16125 [Balneolaceae bacterium]|nr:hypothetical protein [Balneolaceae bacterium]
MKLKILPLILLAILISVIAYNELYLKKQLNKAEEASNPRIVESAHNYLKKNLALNLSKDDFNFPVSVENKIFVYIPTSACASCVDKLLHILGDYEIDSKILIFVDSEEHVEYIVNYNDRFLHAFNIKVSDKAVRNFQNNIIVYSSINDKVGGLLAFNSGDGEYFKKHFERYMF